MKFKKNLALILSAVMVLSMAVPVSAAENEAVAEVEAVSADNEVVEIKTAEEIFEEVTGKNVNEAASVDAETLSNNSADSIMKFIKLMLMVRENKQYAFKTKTGTVSNNGYAYLGTGATQKLALTDITGAKVKGLKKNDVEWNVFSYDMTTDALTESPAEITVKNGVVKCGKSMSTNAIVYVFGTYNGVASCETMIVRPKTIAFLQIVHNKAKSSAAAAKTYSVGQTISVDNIQALVGTTAPTKYDFNDTIFYSDRKTTKDLGFVKRTTYSIASMPVTSDYEYATDYVYKFTDGSYVSLGAYDIKVSKPKNITAVTDHQGNVTSFIANKRGTYSVTYTCNDGSNKKFVVKVKVS